MNQSLYEFKVKLLETGIFRHQSKDEYTCECPNCGDRRKHCYVLIRLTDDTPVVYNCFKCTAKGIVNQKFLEYFNLDNIQIPNYKFSKKIEVQSSASAKMNITSVTEEDDIREVSDYILERIGVLPTLEELQYFQYVAKPKLYASEYLGYDGKNDSQFRQRHWFRLTNGTIHGRLDSMYEDGTKRRWQRFQSNRVKGVGLYTVKKPFDLYETINVCIAEGIVDVMGLYYHGNIPNPIFIAVLGKNYTKGIEHILNMGIFGDSVNIKIFKDPNVNADEIFVPFQMQKIFKHIDVYENALGFDYGVHEDKIEINRVRKIR